MPHVKDPSHFTTLHICGLLVSYLYIRHGRLDYRCILVLSGSLFVKKPPALMTGVEEMTSNPHEGGTSMTILFLFQLDDAFSEPPPYNQFQAVSRLLEDKDWMDLDETRTRIHPSRH
jgi:hypothetical protein